METQMEDREPQTDAVKLPAPTAWPMVLALGLSLVIAGMVTTGAISLLGLVLALIGSVGWFRQVLPMEQHESVAVQPHAIPAVSARAAVARLSISPLHRKMLPVETYKITAGIKAGSRAGSRCRSQRCCSA